MLNNHLAPAPRNVDEFYAQCRLHDWGFEHSDDHRYWEAGRKNEARLIKLAESNNQYMVILRELSDWSVRWSTGEDMPTLKACLEISQIPR